MGTNYYTRENECDKCGRYEQIHLGKSSHGWQFTFQYNGGLYYKGVTQMENWLKDKNIWNEYNEPVTHEDFWGMVKEKQNSRNKNHAEYVKTHHPESARYEHNIDGYSFTDREFS